MPKKVKGKAAGGGSRNDAGRRKMAVGKALDKDS